MPETVPLAKPPLPSASIHSALESIGFMACRGIEAEQQDDQSGNDEGCCHWLAPCLESWIKCHAAVDKQGCALHIIGFITRQPNGCASDFFRLADAFVGNQLEQFVVMLRRVPSLHVDR